MSNQDCIAAHKHCSNHSDRLSRDQVCGCFHCGRIFTPADIGQWVQMKIAIAKDSTGKPVAFRTEEQATALCPFCGVDAVIGESAGYPITETFLAEMHRYWFVQEK